MEGLAERDRCEMAADFAAIAHADDFMTTFRALGRKHFQDEPRGKAILCLEIWAEATRNATMGEITRTFEREVMGRLAALIEEAQGRGEIPCQVDAHGIAVIICTLGDGLFVRRAILPDFDAEEEVGRVLHLIGALLKGEASLGEANLQHERCDAEASS
ncbi:TetR family transcriptional regulator C-terminal domain-containing protein [Chelatococcus sp. SYSU_G07232]|uniref:TetR family transcriptional regulator C-terminal domain-containing protein n=1 Tax=Chelatococcus albus TaxID=3047466 RepID=A0ABT7ALD5_9HYPH|nr:TetR family transcriptional regulator C-terminal domain-containing protein [Chelatococcus sp. SYSU_G07232]MDJ1160198.1 TetR family transcriptional regulator C-terminal domain-containing protein [Chelatococcus sp. SYSU_G07232]